MAVTYQVNTCNDLAIRRCKDQNCNVPGGAAFCAAHYGASEQINAPHAWSLCVPCARAAERRELETQNAELERQDRVTEAIARIRELAQALSDHRVPREKYFHGTKEVAGWFTRRRGRGAEARAEALGRTRTVENPAGHRYGWCVGDVDWDVPRPPRDSRFDLGGRSVITVQTYVTTDGELDSASVTAGYNCYVADADKPAFWYGIIRTLEDLAKSHGVG